MLGLGLNINKYSRGSSPLLLDLYTGAGAAFSLRDLSTSYIGNPVVRLRRSSDNAESDFSAVELTNGTLTTWIGGNTGYVTTWYDQTGNGNHFIQATSVNQPVLVSSGTYLEEIEFLYAGLTKSLVVDLTSFFDIGNISTFAALRFGSNSTSSADNNIPLSNTTASQRFYPSISDGTNIRFGYAGSAFGSIIKSLDTILFLTSLHAGTGTVEGYANGILKYSVTASSGYTSPSRLQSAGNNTHSLIKELIIYPSDNRVNRVAIEENINNYYNIY